MDALGRSQPPAAGSGYPAQGLVKGPRRLGEIEHGLLDPSAGRRLGRMTHHADTPRAMNDHARNRVEPTVAWHRHMDEARWLMRETMQFGRGLIAQGGARPGAQHGRPEQRGAAGLSAKCGEDAEVEPLPLATVKPRSNRVPRQACAERLTARDHAILELSQALQAVWEIEHVLQRGSRRCSQAMPIFKPVDNQETADAQRSRRSLPASPLRVLVP